MSCRNRSAAIRQVANRMRGADERPFENARIHTSESLKTTTRMPQHPRRINHRTPSSRADASSSLICDGDRQGWDKHGFHSRVRTNVATKSDDGHDIFFRCFAFRSNAMASDNVTFAKHAPPRHGEASVDRQTLANGRLKRTCANGATSARSRISRAARFRAAKSWSAFGRTAARKVDYSGRRARAVQISFPTRRWY